MRGRANLPVPEELAKLTRQSKHGVLVRADCVLGPMLCRTCTSGGGCFVLVQAITPNVGRRPRRATVPVGPLRTEEDLDANLGRDSSTKACTVTRDIVAASSVKSGRGWRRRGLTPRPVGQTGLVMFSITCMRTTLSLDDDVLMAVKDGRGGNLVASARSCPSWPGRR